LSFIEFLSDSSLSVPTIKNYISAIKSSFKLHNVPIQPFLSPQLTLTLASLNKNWVPNLSLKPVISPFQLTKIIAYASKFPLNPIYNVAYIFGFMAMLRISNLAPTSPSLFDSARHLRRGDVTIVNGTLFIHLRWTKTLQKYHQSARIPLFPIPNSQLCPIRAFINLQKIYPVSPNSPFLSFVSAGKLHIVTQSHLNKVFKRIVLSLGYHQALTFHSLRRSGASLAFASGIPFHSIQAHGTWSSDALWAYIDANARDVAVPLLFVSAFSGF
jgi:integrase